MSVYRVANRHALKLHVLRMSNFDSRGTRLISIQIATDNGDVLVSVALFRIMRGTDLE